MEKKKRKEEEGSKQNGDAKKKTRRYGGTGLIVGLPKSVLRSRFSLSAPLRKFAVSDTTLVPAKLGRL